MGERLSRGQLDFVRRAAKEITRRLVPDELPFYDTVWRALEPVLRTPASQSPDARGPLELAVDRLEGFGLTAKGSRDADLLAATTVMLLGRCLGEALATGTCSEDQIGESVARQSLRCPLPNRFLRMAQRFVTAFCGGVSEPDSETEDLFYNTRLPAPQQCYLVFHNGSDNFYANAVPPEVLQLRETVLFWIYRARGDFCSRGHPRPKGPGPQAERVLRFLCHERNAGKTIPLQDLFSSVWLKRPGSRTQHPVGSIRVEVSKLNGFADEPFESEGGGTMIRSFREAYIIDAKTPAECCIVRPISLPE